MMRQYIGDWKESTEREKKENTAWQRYNNKDNEERINREREREST